MHRFLLLIILIVSTFQTACASEPNMDLKVGQVWNIKSDKYTNAKVIIQKIDLDDLDRPAIHITVTGPFFLKGGKIIPLLAHVPISDEALLSSVTTISEVDQHYESWFQEGYKTWYDTEEAGVYSISVNEILKFGFETINDEKNQVVK